MLKEIIDKTSFIVMAASWLFCWIYFWNYSNEAFYSFFAAVLSALFIWIGYISARLLFLALRK